MAGPAVTVSEFRVGSVLDRGFSILISNIVPFGLLSLLGYICLHFLEVISAKLSFHFAFVDRQMIGEVDDVLLYLRIRQYSLLLDLLFYFLLDFLVTATLVYGTFQDLRGQRASLGACIRRGLGLIIPVIGVAFVSTLAIAAGFIALVIPGLIVATILWVVIPVAVLERLGVGASLKRSAELTKGYRWRIFYILILYAIIRVVAGIIGESVVNDTNDSLDFMLITWVPNPSMFVTLVLNAFFAALWAVVIAVGYYDLRVVKEGTDIEQIAAAFD